MTYPTSFLGWMLCHLSTSPDWLIARDRIFHISHSETIAYHSSRCRSRSHSCPTSWAEPILCLATWNRWLECQQKLQCYSVPAPSVTQPLIKNRTNPSCLSCRMPTDMQKQKAPPSFFSKTLMPSIVFSSTSFIVDSRKLAFTQLDSTACQSIVSENKVIFYGDMILDARLQILPHGPSLVFAGLIEPNVFLQSCFSKLCHRGCVFDDRLWEESVTHHA